MAFLRIVPIALVAVVLALLVGSGRPVSAQPPACGTVTTDTTLTGDCTGPMVVAASNIEIDLNGFAVGSSACVGIQIIGQTNVSVEDGTVTGSPKNCPGILIDGGGGHRLEDLEVTGNGGFGIDLGGDSNTVWDNTITGNGFGGLIAFGDEHIIEDNDVSNNGGFGIALAAGAQNNRVEDNTAFGNLGVGGLIFDLFDVNDQCDNNLWEDNEFGAANRGCIQ